MARVLSENAVAAVEQDPVELLGGVSTGYGYGRFRGEPRDDCNSLLVVLWLGVPQLSVLEEPYLGRGDHEVGFDLRYDALEEGLLVLLDTVGGVLGRDEHTGYREGDGLCVD